MEGQAFDDEDHLNQWLTNFFHQKPKKFNADDIYTRPEKWQKIISGDGESFFA